MNDIISLCELTGVSGFEFEISSKIAKLFEKYCEQTNIDAFGNVAGIIGKGNKIKIMIEAHLDEIGLIVKNIDSEGFIRFACIGGVNPSILPAAEVFIHGKETLFGVVGSKPPHLQTAEESKKEYKTEELYIDVGFSQKELAEKIQIGDPISFACKSATLINNMLVSKAIDNRMGVSCLLRCMQRLRTKPTNFEIVFLAAVQEEIGCKGAKVGTYRISPDYAIIIDVTHGTTPYTKDKDSAFELGKGAAIGVGPNFHPGLTRKIIESAGQLPYAIEVCSSNSGTDAWVVQITKKGIPCALISAPLKYMHSPVEMVCNDDVNIIVDIICNFLEEGYIC
ncbi:MAG: M20/M25/M40 family metallo-hydrolase [Firmicutes bacterium]|nr:M20/M25/M40 family metallo-hydrolase [Bacillota bacterium]